MERRRHSDLWRDCDNLGLPREVQAIQEVTPYPPPTQNLVPARGLSRFATKFWKACLGDAEPSEFRTAPLWGLRFSRTFMHDGLSKNVTDAIMRHGGEGAGARKGFAALRPDDKAELVKFLGSL